MNPRLALALWRERTGATAIEFALVMPLVLMVMIGGINLCLVAYTIAGLHYATEAASRCASLDATTCGTSATVNTYAKNRFINVSGATPTFTLASASCGFKVTASMTYPLNLGVRAVNLPLSSQACMP
jgi:Flp pilus assembly protein TadG